MVWGIVLFPDITLPVVFLFLKNGVIIPTWERQDGCFLYSFLNV